MYNVSGHRWYQEPWVWFNLILLTVAVIAASVMSIIAVRHTPAEIGSSWYQEGVLAKRERHQEALVAAMHLQALMNVSREGVIVVTLKHDHLAGKENQLILPATLTLYIEHPFATEGDQVIILKHMKDDEFTGKLKSALSGKRKLMLTSGDDSWFLMSSSYFPLSGPLTFLPVMS